ncbi:MAG: FAD-dependent oxidoreductase [Acidobacteriaceae bacterium]|nr:FAD-dependent oxidoreductase [Acidobacteriaceae bacterium]
MRIAVIGAGAFGGWTALQLLRGGAQVTLIDAWGPGNSKASSGGETRIIRSIYGDDQISFRFAQRSLQLWKEYEQRWNTRLYYRTGALFMGGRNDEFLEASKKALDQEGVSFEELSPTEAHQRFPQINFAGIESVLYEGDAGCLTARENCRTVVTHFIEEGGRFEINAVGPQSLTGDLSSLSLADGSALYADGYVLACGPWLGELFPDVLGSLLRPSKQDVIFVAPPSGDRRFAIPLLPCWADRTSEEKFYGMPDIQNRGFKIASDLRGRTFDPNTTDRFIDPQSWVKAREFLRFRFPALADAPVTETRVCQYENTPDLALLVDRHPAAKNVFLVGGGSGHGYKHGPAIGEYVADIVLRTRQIEPAWSLSRFKDGTLLQSELRQASI